jgi:glycosyltransferase involved in cell wall biosynthesis
VKVLLSVFQCAPGQGSEPGVGWGWASGLADAGHEVTVLTQMEYRDHLLGQGRSDIDFQFFDPPGRRQKIPGIGVYGLYLRWQDAAIDHAQGLHKQFDVVHHPVWASLHLGTRLWRMPAPLVYGPIGGGQTAPAHYRRYFGRHWPMELLRNATTGRLLQLDGRARETMRNASVVLVDNSATEAAARRLGAKDVRSFVSQGLPVNWISAPRKRPSGTPVVAWAGRMLARKAPALAVEAFAELRKTMPARLIMAGDGPMLEEVRATVARLGVADDVDLLGQVPWNQVKDLYDSASVFLFNSLRDSLGGQFIEALGRGVPAVALDLNGIHDLDVGAAAEKVQLPRRPQELPSRIADALRRILSADDWEIRSKTGLAVASEHLWPTKIAAMSSIYREFADDRRKQGSGHDNI